MRRDICRPAETRLNERSTEEAKQFDSTILHNAVADRLREDDELRGLLHVTEEAYSLSDWTDYDDVDNTAFSAADNLDRRVDDVVQRAVAAIVADVYSSVDGWGDTWRDDQIKAAKDEAETWFEQTDDDLEVQVQ